MSLRPQLLPEGKRGSAAFPDSYQLPPKPEARVPKPRPVPSTWISAAFFLGALGGYAAGHRSGDAVQQGHGITFRTLPI
jgi:hypothetical protein